MERAAPQLDIPFDPLPAGNVERDGLRIQSSVKYLDRSGTGRSVVDQIGARFVGENRAVGAPHGDAGVVKKITGERVLHSTGDAAQG